MMFHDLWASRELAWRLLVRNISAQYRQSLLGYVWAFLPPIATALIWVFLNSQKIVNAGETDIPYPVYVMIGTLLWSSFTDALNSPLNSITGSKSMLAKINFPREALLLAGLGDVGFRLMIRLIVLALVFLWFQVAIPTTILLAPFGILTLIALGSMIGLLLVPIGMLYNDVPRGLGMALQLWFYITPVVYQPLTQGLLATLTQVNPISTILVTTRNWLAVGDLAPAPGFGLILGATLVLLFVGWVLFRLAMPHLIERISA